MCEEMESLRQQIGALECRLGALEAAGGDTRALSPVRSRKRPSGLSVVVDVDRFHALLVSNHLTQAEAGKRVGLGAGWVPSVLRRGRANYFRLDALAAELGADTEELVQQLAPAGRPCQPGGKLTEISPE